MPPGLPGAAEQTLPLVLDVSTKVVALFENPPLKHNSITLPEHFSVGRMPAALERVCNPCAELQELCGWESQTDSSWICIRSGLSFQEATS